MDKMDNIREQSRLIISKIISKEEYENYHKRFIDMWNWLAEDPLREKEDYFKTNYIYCESKNMYCFGCMIADYVNRGLLKDNKGKELLEDLETYLNLQIEGCDFCPLKRGFNDSQCSHEYFMWEYFTNHVYLYAHAIADKEWYSYEEYCEILGIILDYYE